MGGNPWVVRSDASQEKPLREKRKGASIGQRVRDYLHNSKTGGKRGVVGGRTLQDEEF